MIYIILGMHKSGTTLISQILHFSGINMGDDFDPDNRYDKHEDNRAKYERTSTSKLNKRILGLKDGRFIDFKAPSFPRITDTQRDRMQNIVKTCNETYNNWGFKDPRTALVYPLWAAELPEHKIITIYRPPGELWPRFRYDSLRLAYQNPYWAWQLVSRWYEYNIRILTYLKHTKKEYLVLSYRELMTADIEFHRLQRFVGSELNDKRKKKLYRSRSDSYFLIKIATWLLYKQTGYTPEQIIKQFETLRQSQLSKYYDESYSP